MGGLEPQQSPGDRHGCRCPIAGHPPRRSPESRRHNSSSALHVCFQEGTEALLASQSGGPLGYPRPPLTRPRWMVTWYMRAQQRPLEEAEQPHALQGGKQALPGSRFHGQFGDPRSP